MKIKVIHDEGSLNNYGELEIKLTTENGTKSITVREGEPEDMNFGRNLSDVFNIPDLLQMAYNAGKNGELFEMEWVENEY